MKRITLAATIVASIGLASAANSIEGELPASFYVSEDQVVVFAKGNLQFQASEGEHLCADGSTKKGTWRLADSQLDFIGADNALLGEEYNGYIDLFAWGTSGWEGGIEAYQPWSTTTDHTAYYPGGGKNTLTGDYAYSDWGVYNAISNAGNTPNIWRTLRAEEWVYLFTHQAWTLCYADDILCFMLIPTDFIVPAGVAIAYVYEPNGTTPPTEFEDALWASNVYTQEQYEAMEKAGVVFLPAAGVRAEKEYMLDNGLGYYWSTTHAFDEDPTWALGPGFGITSANAQSVNVVYQGRSVRLVRDVTIGTSISQLPYETEEKAEKVVRDGRVLIVRGEKVYDLLGNPIE